MSCLYETCLSDFAWEVIESLFPANAKRGRPRVYSFRSIVNGIFYVFKKRLRMALFTQRFSSSRHHLLLFSHPVCFCCGRT
ncbi:MAG: transposase [Myxococcales bacterium]|nr:transposase [Myxococcales bacterium]